MLNLRVYEPAANYVNDYFNLIAFDNKKKRRKPSWKTIQFIKYLFATLFS